MTKAFLFDSLCGMVYRCMFAGLDDYGHAQLLCLQNEKLPLSAEHALEMVSFC